MSSSLEHPICLCWTWMNTDRSRWTLRARSFLMISLWIVAWKRALWSIIPILTIDRCVLDEFEYAKETEKRYSRRIHRTNCPDHSITWRNTSLPIQISLHRWINPRCLVGVTKIASLLFISSSFSVCKSFRRIAYDDELWKTVDLTKKSYSNRVLVKFFRRFARECTEILRISGVPNGKKTKNNLMKLSPYTEQLSYFIRSSYPNLRSLYISKYDFRDDPTACKNITYLPGNLQSLHLTQCEMLMTSIQGTSDFLKIPACPLKNATSDFSLQSLEILSFEQSSCLGLMSVRYLPSLCPHLIELNLNGCFRITRTRAFTDTLLAFHKTLRRLYLKETQVDDDTLHCICRKLKLLTCLDIRLCKYVTINVVENLLTLPQLSEFMADSPIQTAYEARKQAQILPWWSALEICAIHGLPSTNAAERRLIQLNCTPHVHCSNSPSFFLYSSLSEWFDCF